MDRLLSIYTSPVSADESKAIAGATNATWLTQQPQSWTSGQAGISQASHWFTWIPAGKRAILWQIREKRDQPPRLYLVLPDKVLRILETAGLVISGQAMAIGGTLVMRRSAGEPKAYERERARTLSSLHAAIAPAEEDGQELVFLARECLYYGGSRAETDDFQTRMVLARTLVDGEPGKPHTSAFTSQGCFRILYQPHMAPSQAPVMTRDVPPPLVGTTLVGVELYPADEKTHNRLVLTNSYDEAICLLVVEKK